MAVINVFESSAQLGAPANNQANFRPDNGGAMAVAAQDANIAKTVVEGGNKLYEQMAVADVMKANNDINMRMNEVRNKLLQNKEQNALNNMTIYEEERRKIIDDVVKNGPASLRTGIGNRALMATVDKDWTSRKDFMERYQYGEMEKYQDTQLGNQYKLGLKNIADEYLSQEQVEENIRRGEAMTAYRFMNYGPEKVKQMQDRWRSAAMATAVQASLAADNYDRAGQLLQGYGDYLDPAVKMQFDKVVMARKKSDDQIVSFEDIYNRYGDDVEGALAELGSKTGMADTAAGMNFARSQEGKQWGDNTCAIYTSAYITAAGGDERLKSTLSDGTYRNAEELGLTFSDRSQLLDGDLVYYSGTSQRYAASDDPNAVESGDKAYKGITHVGVYDAKTGKVIQSGSHGVSAIDIDTYNVVGFSHIGGRELSPTEQKQKEKEYLAYARGQNALKQQRRNALVEQTADSMFAAYKQGIRDPKYYMDIVKEVAGNNYKIYQNLAPIASAFSDNGNYKLTVEEQVELEAKIMDGGVPQDELIQQLQAKGVSGSTIMEYVHKNQKALKGDGTYKFSWNGMEQALKERLGGKISDEDMMNIKIYGNRFVADYLEKNQRLPTNDEVLDVMQEGLAKGVGGVKVPGAHFWSSDIEYNSAQLAGHGIYYISNTPDGRVAVYFYGNNEPVYMTKEAFANKMGK